MLLLASLIFLLLLTTAAMIGFAAVNEQDSNYVLAAWTAGLGIFFALEGLLRLAQANDDVKRHQGILTFVHVLGLVVALVLFFMYGAGHAWGAFVFSLVLFVIHGVDLGVVRRSVADAKSSEAPQRSCPKRSLLWCNCFFFCIAILLQILLLGGAGYAAYQRTYYSPRGNFVSYQTSDGKPQSLLLSCQGPASSPTVPRVFIMADYSHGAADFWPLQRDLVAQGVRACIFDPPGLGWSDLFYPTQSTNVSTWMAPFLAATGEAPPYTLVGWGGGGASVLDYAQQNPTQVKSLVFLGFFPPGVEWRFTFLSKNYTAAQVEKNRALMLRGRLFLFGIIRGLGVPWGLMSPLVPSSPTSYNWTERFNEYHTFYLVGKTWTTQLKALSESMAAEAANPYQSVNDRTPLINNPNSAILGKPVLSMVYPPNATRACNYISDKASPECQEAIQYDQFLYNEALITANVTGNARIVNCTEPGCDLGFPLRYSWSTATAIRKGFDDGFL